MTSEVIVDVQPKDISIALLEDKRLVEFQQEGRSEQFSVGNIYLAKVKKIMNGLNACFVNVGYERDAFLHYQDLGVHYRALENFLGQQAKSKQQLSISKHPKFPDLEKDGSIQNMLKTGQEVLVQIVKEPISTKGPRLTCDISFAGRYLVLIPFSDKISVSTKIKSAAERARLKQLIHSIKPKNCGVIIRTVAEGKRVADLDAEIKTLYQRWENVVTNIRKHKTEHIPILAHEETSRTVALLRDLFNPSYENIYINDRKVYEEVREYVSIIAPERHHIVKFYQGNLPIFDNFSVTKQIKSSFGRSVTYKQGAYLVIEHTEALHVIDVNSGNRSKAPEGQETNALDVNLGAADEIARQLRLRDMGGIIIVDFIDMHQTENRQKLYERMCQNMQNDRARHNILPLSKFGLMQITRQRVRPVMAVKVEEDCPTCEGSGKIKSSLLFTDILEGKIKILTMDLDIKKFLLHVHPFVEAYISKGLISLKRKWQMKYGLGFKIIPNQKLSYLQYQFFEPNGEELDMQEFNEMH